MRQAGQVVRVGSAWGFREGDSKSDANLIQIEHNLSDAKLLSYAF